MVTARDMVETFQCPGCAHGSDTQCGKFKLHELPAGTSHEGNKLVPGFRCQNHQAAKLGETQRVNLGLPVPFARVQYREGSSEVQTNIRMHLYPVNYGVYWDAFNVPVWALEKGDYLFVRTYIPRVDQSYVDIIKGGNVDLIRQTHPNVIDIGPVADKIKL